MSDPQSILDKAMVLMDQHLDQIRIVSTYSDKGSAKGLAPTDAAVIERYAKILLVMTKQAGLEPDDTNKLTDAELQEQARLILEDKADAAPSRDTQ